MNGETQNGSGGIMVKYWQIILMLLIQFASIAVAYGRTSQRLDDIVDRQQKMEQAKPVSQDEFREYQQEMRDRYAKIDADLRELIHMEKTK